MRNLFNMLIILYGEVSNKTKWKHQRMIDGGSTCGYREYARNFGHIVYVTPQQVKLPWEHSIVEPENIIKFISKHPKCTLSLPILILPTKLLYLLS